MTATPQINQVTPCLRYYISQYILPFYTKNDPGHQLNHIKHVMKRSFQLATNFSNLKPNNIYVCVTFHDLTHHIDKDHHDILSAQFFRSDSVVTSFFSPTDQQLIFEAIADHRSTSSHSPRNDYGKVLATADLNTSVDSAMQRTHVYTVRHFPNISLDEAIQRGYQHLKEKFDTNGYAKAYCPDPEYDAFKAKMISLLNSQTSFRQYYLEANDLHP